MACSGFASVIRDEKALGFGGLNSREVWFWEDEGLQN
jgi:hypothetical protein